MTNADATQQPADDSSIDVDAGASGSAEVRARPSAPIPSSPVLESLTSRYIPDQHATYLRHLEQAVVKPKNLNIALTGRYGTGKSSVLDEFISKNESRSLRIAISTLGPASADASLTNRIQKELVKQLLYRAAPRDLRFSRFNRIVPLSMTRAIIQAATTVGVVGPILAFLGWLPAVAGTGPNHHWPIRASSWIAFAGLIVVMITTLQRVICGRFFVSNVSAAGATVTLTQRNSTYFDEYLEEIVYFFDETSSDIVIFEDLDRFDDPHIFEALRELNTLLNQAARRREKREPLRFIYAIKDSLFEQLGSDTIEPTDDAAAAETVRANRTKFFDIVIPLVPFISHQNARELLTGLLRDHGFLGIDRSLITLVAQHSTDMRLLRNICNEYAVFADRLIASGKTAPGLTASNLFALVAYKNFHLADFEEIPRRNSDLDTLYDQRRKLVRATVDACEKRKRDLLNEPQKYKEMQSLASQLGDRIIIIGTALKNVSHANFPYLQFQFSNPDRRSQDQAKSYQFWAAMKEANEVRVFASPQPLGNGGPQVARFDRSQIQVLFPEMSDVNQWAEIDEDEYQATLARIDDDVAFLRGADFKDLASEDRFTLPIKNDARTFSDLIDMTIKSQLARDLIKQGYLDRNFTLYAAQFYGEFTGIDVANFLVQSVQTNQMDVDYTFSGHDAIANLLLEAPGDFSHSISAYNIEVLDYFLEKNDLRAKDVADTIASNFGNEAQDFLRAYFNSGSRRARFAALLSSRPWPHVFTYLIEDPGIPVDVRPTLVDAALRESKDHTMYKLSSELRDFIVANYPNMAGFTSRQDDEVASKLVAFIKEVRVILPTLAGLDREFRDRVVHENLYLLTADNLREALGTTGAVSFDRVCQNADVYGRCLQDPSTYLTAMKNDTGTSYSVLTKITLTKVLTEVAESWEAEQVRELIAMAAPETQLDHLDHAFASCWPELAAHHHFRSTVRNVHAYRDTIGSIDQNLTHLIVQAGRIDSEEESEAIRMNVAIDVLNAATIPDAGKRVNLVASLHLELPLSPAKVQPEAGELFALLLNHDLIEDSHESFARFRSAGWPTIELAIAKSTNFVEFMTPELISDFTTDFLNSEVVTQQATDKIVDDLAQYLPTDEAAALSAAGHYASARGRPLPLDQVRRIATTTHDGDLTVKLLAITSPLPPAPDLVTVLAVIGEPYSNLATKVKHEFEIPATEEHRTVFDRLKEAGLVSECKKRRGKAVYIVKLA